MQNKSEYKKENLLRLMFESWANTDQVINNTEDILKWISDLNDRAKVSVKQIDYSYENNELNSWYYDQSKGQIVHKSGRFFQISGIEAKNKENIIEQPIIIQNEIGYLGIIGKVINGTLYFLMQAKIEPGNINLVQISPTIQATKSNFMQVHGGKSPDYLDYFINSDRYEIIVDQIQSEQSSRFLGKRNRNIIIVVDDDIEVLPNFKWMTLGQIKEMMKYDNLVNMDTRTVISCIPFAMGDYNQEDLNLIKKCIHNPYLYNSLFHGDVWNGINSMFHYINNYKMLDQADVRLKDIFKLENWHFNHGVISKDSGGEFQVIYCNIEISGREVQSWSQPLLEATEPLTFALLYRIHDDKYEFLVHAKPEIGCFDTLEIGPSVQTVLKEPGNNIVQKTLLENMNNKNHIAFKGVFSEEGGRFYHEQNQYMLIKADIMDDDLPEGYFWTDLETLNVMTQFNNCLNIQLRSLLSLINF